MLTAGQVIVRLLVSAILSGIIGIERESKHKPAGLRTNILVGIGSTLAMITSLAFDGEPSRIAAGVLTGIGFVGAGLVIQDRHEIHGITTAATIWVVSAVGLAAGAGFFVPAIATTLLAVMVLYFFESEKFRRSLSEKQ
ncbi:MAG: hypothetical protein A2951_01435 [Candidatus Buchananbacteria bacterium RIFCSPLOWO2_01_FULL_56_15]|uniref:MgtC/SapB/SrpB/YhiD N-terminal domain-containing protein n=1 Tax=Candidatus Buchananbacteria bacterium RIFCSPLOWO2_01_FULL_56_15 TaxID=1797547 RepID=A0A1G1YR12_9BACT|nr:MAG: hypothetical protein A2951_01435 [Candidatus Buchananbacteria bacterium RIFCSPLOWO2_01_FULL_56_15]